MRNPEHSAGWRQATLASSRRYNDRLWLICNGCHRSYLVMHDEFVAFHQLDPSTTFLRESKCLRCVIAETREDRVGRRHMAARF